MKLNIISLESGFAFLPGPMEQSSTQGETIQTMQNRGFEVAVTVDLSGMLSTIEGYNGRTCKS